MKNKIDKVEWAGTNHNLSLFEKDGILYEWKGDEESSTKLSSEKVTKLDSEYKIYSDEYDAQAYARKRAKEYPPMADQLDMQYHDAVNGTTTWKDAIAKVKSDNPK